MKPNRATQNRPIQKPVRIETKKLREMLNMAHKLEQYEQANGIVPDDPITLPNVVSLLDPFVTPLYALKARYERLMGTDSLGRPGPSHLGQGQKEFPPLVQSPPKGLVQPKGPTQDQSKLGQPLVQRQSQMGLPPVQLKGSTQVQSKDLPQNWAKLGQQQLHQVQLGPPQVPPLVQHKGSSQDWMLQQIPAPEDLDPPQQISAQQDSLAQVQAQPEQPQQFQAQQDQPPQENPLPQIQAQKDPPQQISAQVDSLAHIQAQPESPLQFQAQQDQPPQVPAQQDLHQDPSLLFPAQQVPAQQDLHQDPSLQFPAQQDLAPQVPKQQILPQQHGSAQLGPPMYPYPNQPMYFTPESFLWNAMLQYMNMAQKQ